MCIKHRRGVSVQLKGVVALRFICSVLFWMTSMAIAEPQFVDVDEYKIEYEIAGSGDTTIFLEAGGASSLDDWESIFHDIAKHAKVIRYSRVGNGRSTKVRKNFSSNEYAEEALKLMSELGIDEKVVFIAHSYGAYIARIFVATYPEKVSALMLIDPSSEHDVDIVRKIDLEKGEKEIESVKRSDLENGLSNNYLDFWAKRPLPDYPEIPDIPVTVIASIKTYENPPLEIFFSDKARKMWGELHSDWANAFPQGRAVLTDKSYHFPQQDEPEMVVREVLALIDRARNH